jgi:hypothetical protein
VRNIEDTGGAPHGVMLANLGSVLNGHFPAAEVDDPGA